MICFTSCVGIFFIAAAFNIPPTLALTRTIRVVNIHLGQLTSKSLWRFPAKKIPPEMEVTLRYILLTLLTVLGCLP